MLKILLSSFVDSIKFLAKNLLLLFVLEIFTVSTVVITKQEKLRNYSLTLNALIGFCALVYLSWYVFRAHKRISISFIAWLEDYFVRTLGQFIVGFLLSFIIFLVLSVGVVLIYGKTASQILIPSLLSTTFTALSTILVTLSVYWLYYEDRGLRKNIAFAIGDFLGYVGFYLPLLMARLAISWIPRIVFVKPFLFTTFNWYASLISAVLSPIFSVAFLIGFLKIRDQEKLALPTEN